MSPLSADLFCGLLKIECLSIWSPACQAKNDKSDGLSRKSFRTTYRRGIGVGVQEGDVKSSHKELVAKHLRLLFLGLEAQLLRNS